jgi:hypothetical protein
VVTGVAVERRALLEWQERVPDEPVEVGPPEEGSFLELPGARQRPVRPKLEPVAAYGGALAGRALRGDGTPLPVLLLGEEPRVVDVMSPPLGIAARDDGGCWALHDGQVVHHDATGSAVRAPAVAAIALVPAPDDGVWAVGRREAWRIDGDGKVSDPFEWRGGLGSAPADGGLAATARDAIVTLEAPSVSPEPGLDPHERLLACTGGVILTRGSGGLRRRAGGRLEHIPLQSAGLASDGTPWISGRAGPQTVELRRGGSVECFDVPDRSPGVLRVVAVDGEEVLVAALDHAWQLRDGTVEDGFAIDDDSYRDRLFGRLWELTAVSATPSGGVLVGASGPPGLATLSVDWPA